MSAPDGTTHRAWLYAFAMAWATSGLLLLDESRLLYGLACLVWLGLAWRCLAGTRLALARRALSVVLALALPAQASATVAAEIHGPAHVHSAPVNERQHWHGEIRHHHHAQGEAVLVGDDSRPRAALFSAEDKRATLCPVDALAGRALLMPSLPGSDLIFAGRSAPAATLVSARPERPPRLLRDSLPA